MSNLKAKRKETIKKMLCSCEKCDDSEIIFKSLQEFGEKLQFNEEFTKILDFLTALGSRERLIIVLALKKKDRCVCELETILDKSQPSISHHLRELEKANLIKGWKKGKFTYYGLVKSQLKSYLRILSEEFDFD